MDMNKKYHYSRTQKKVLGINQLPLTRDHLEQEGLKQSQGNVKFVVLIHGIQILLEGRPYVQNVVMLPQRI
jgi:hypothetical protein